MNLLIIHLKYLFSYTFSQSYSYDVYTPPEPPAHPGLSAHGYHVEQLKPLPAQEPAVLFGHIDRVVVQNKDCDEKVEYPKTDGCGACGNCPCNCHTRNQGGKLSDYLTRGNSDIIILRYDKSNKPKGRVRKKRFLSKLKTDKNKIDNSNIKKYRSTDDDTTLLQLSFLKKLPKLKKPVVDECGAYHYKSCGHRSTNCPECYNCTCLPIKNSHTDMDELVSAALDPNFVIPDKYDPIMRQEVSSEPNQYTDQSKADYQRLTEVLQQRSRMDPGYAGGLISPPPAKQTQEMLELLIDLMDNKQDVKAYKQSKTFQNPHDWMYVVDTDSLAYKVGQNQYMDVLPLNQLEHHNKVKYIDNRPRFGIQLPAREPPKPLYGQIDNVAELYKTFKQNSPVSIQELIAPVNKILDFQAKQQVEDEKRKESLLKAFKVKRDTRLSDRNKTLNSIDQPTRRRPPWNQTAVEVIDNLYQKYIKILNQIEQQEALSQEPQTQKFVLKVKKEDKSKLPEKKEPPNFVVLKEDSGILLGDEVPSSQLADNSFESESETSDQVDENYEFIS